MATRNAWRSGVADTWNEAARGWEYWDAVLMGSMSAVNPVLQRALAIRPGQVLLDAGCGPGEPALSFAPLLVPGGRVLGVDVSRAMIAIARRRARARGIRNARFVTGDMTDMDARLRFDRIVSRYGIMFAEDPEALLARLRHHLRSRGRAAFAVWGPFAKNAYHREVFEAARPFVRGPVPDPETTPHPFRFARAGRLAGLLRSAGYREIRAEGVQTPFTFQSPAQYADAVLDVSASTRRMLAGFGPKTIERMRRRLERGAAQYREGEVIRLPGFAWVVSGAR